ncbi:MAG: polyprenyl synthetase family protein [Bacteroidales bacterium]|jgi:geranylgeranyl diphosphate synthase type II|nr:polyprenyl synthetase family protein [Bacteroidales bacterium]
MYTYEELREIVNKAVHNMSYDYESDSLFEPVKYLMSMGGKRVRPVMVLMACNLFDNKIEKAILPALGMEILHNFTLVHDDIMDRSEMRRGSPTVHRKWNVNQAILSGDVMAFIANECIMAAPRDVLAQVMKIYNTAAIEVCIGQQMDMDFERNTFVSHSDYLRMIELKTAVMIAASLKTGALIGMADADQAEKMYDFGRNLGLAFQIQDDLLDTYGDPEVFGKKTGTDIVANKKTILLIKALELASGQQLKILNEQLKLEVFDPEEKIAKVKSIFDDLNIRKAVEDLAAQYTELAYASLDDVKVEKGRKEELMQLAAGLLKRSS